MNKSNSIVPMKVDEDFKKELWEMKGELEKKHQRDISVREITKAMTEAPAFKKLKQEMIDFAVDKHGSGWDYIILGVTALILCVFMIFYSFAFNEGYTLLHSINLPLTPTVNLTTPVEQTFGQINDSLSNFKWLGVIMIFASFISIMISNYFVRDYPISFLVYVCFIIISVFFSVQVSNAYELAMSNPFISDYASSWIGFNYIMLKLPILLTVIGFIGAVFLVSNIMSPRQESLA